LLLDEASTADPSKAAAICSVIVQVPF
jgi:hypothetical protein